MNPARQKNILITGSPHSGKSTLLQSLVANDPHAIGFVTQEIIKDGSRVGFQIETNKGTISLLAHINLDTSYQVSKYHVDVQALEEAVEEVSLFEVTNLLYIDEIGQMELLSDLCKSLIIKYLESPNVCVATISNVFEDKFITAIKERHDVLLVEITPENREIEQARIKKLISELAE